MPRRRRNTVQRHFSSEFERQQFEIVDSLHEQAKKRPRGPVYAPKGMAGVLAAIRFRNERERSGEADAWRAKYGAGQCQE